MQNKTKEEMNLSNLRYSEDYEQRRSSRRTNKFSLKDLGIDLI